MDWVLWIGVSSLLTLPLALAVSRILQSAGRWDGSVDRMIAADHAREKRVARGLAPHALAPVVPLRPSAVARFALNATPATEFSA